VSNKLELSDSDVHIIDLFSNVSIESFNAIFETTYDEDEFYEIKSLHRQGKLTIEAMIEDNWQELFELQKIDISSDDEIDNGKLTENLLNKLSWCLDFEKSKQLSKQYKNTVIQYLKELKKDKDKSINYRFAPEAILILEKLIDEKKVTEKEIKDCIIHFNLVYVDEFPFAFFYRLIVYLSERNETELLKEVFQKLDEQDLSFPEVWPRSGEMNKIREDLELP
jgi:hypothetical protein